MKNEVKKFFLVILILLVASVSYFSGYLVGHKNLEFEKTLDNIWKIVREDDKFVEENKPWELAKTDKNKFEEVMQKLISDLQLISELLFPFMPETSEKIKKALKEKKAEILFPRIK